MDANEGPRRARRSIDIAVVIVTYESRDDIDALLDSIRCEGSDVRTTVVVVDNDSSDGTLEYIRAAWPDVVAFSAGANVGYAAAINEALRRIGPARAVLVLNPDTVVAPGAAGAMLSALDDPRRGAVVPRILDSRGAVYHSLRREPTLLTALGDALFGRRWRSRPGWLSETVFEESAYARAHTVDWATGAAIMIRADAVEAVGDWDERFFLYSEETDYCRRLRLAGYSIAYEPSAVVSHAQGGSGASPWLTALSSVNRVRYARKHHSAAYAAAFRAIATVAEVLRLGKSHHAGALGYVVNESAWRRLPAAPTRPTFGYLVPEFPGQTHAFFWRELLELRALGARPRLVSTRRPPTALESHDWTGEAIAATTYLNAPTAAQARRAVGVLASAALRGRLAATIRSLRRGPEPIRQKAAILLAGALVAAAAHEDGWTHVHVHSCASSAHVAVVAKRLAGITFSLTLHGPLADYGPRQREKWSETAFALVITQRLRDEVKRELADALPARVGLAPMGVRTRDFARTTPYRPWTGMGEVRVFSCGRLNPAKGHDTLIRSVAALVASGMPTRLTIAGEDDDGGAGYRSFLERLVDELGVADRVTLLGAVDEGTVRRELNSAHVFALASRGEPLGVAIMEAMAMEVPVVVGRGGGVDELIDDGLSGLLVDPEDVEALATAMKSVASDAALAVQLGRAARSRVVAEFGSDRSARVLLEHVIAVVAAE